MFHLAKANSKPTLGSLYQIEIHSDVLLADATMIDLPKRTGREKQPPQFLGASALDRDLFDMCDVGARKFEALHVLYPQV